MLTHWKHNCVNPVILSRAESISFYKYVPPHIKTKAVFSPRQMKALAFFTFKSVSQSPSVEVEKGVEEKRRRKLLFLSVPDNPPSSVSLSSDLSDAVSWNSDSWGECVGKGHKGILSVTVRSPLNNKLINLMDMSSHISYMQVYSMLHVSLYSHWCKKVMQPEI